MYRYEKPVAAGATTASTPEAWAENFAASKKIGRRMRRHMMGSLERKLIERHIPKGSTILDAGCGFGEWVAFLGQQGYRAIGVDYSPELTRRLRETYPDDEWTQSDIRHMPYEEGVIDGVISWGVVEHDEAGPGAALREFHRILRPGGVAVVTVPIDSGPARLAGEVFDRKAGSEHAFFQYLMSEEELRSHGSDAGFEVLESGTLPSAQFAFVAPRLAFRLPALGYRLGNLVARTLLSWVKRYRVMIYVVLRKTW